MLKTYKHLNLLVQVGNFQHLLLQFLDKLLLSLSAFLRQVSCRADLLSTVLVVRVELGVVRGQLTEGFTRSCFDLERLKLFEGVGTVHSLDDRVHIADHLLLEHIGIVR